MRITFIILASAFLFASCAVHQDTTTPEKWLILKGNENDQTVIVRVTERLPELALRQRFPHLLKIQWGYAHTKSGMPTEDDLSYRRTIEDNLEKIVGTQGSLAMARTGNGGTTWFYYIANIEPLRAPIAKFFDDQPPISVKVTIKHDKEWSEVSEVLKAIRNP